MGDPFRLGREEAEDLAARACRSVGADEASTHSLVMATLAAERRVAPVSVLRI
jgi:hypothetical protein